MLISDVLDIVTWVGQGLHAVGMHSLFYTRTEYQTCSPRASLRCRKCVYWYLKKHIENVPCSTKAPLIHSPEINPACWVISSLLSGHQYWLMLNLLSPAPLGSFLLSCSVTHIAVCACIRHCSVPYAEPSIFLCCSSWCWLCSAPVYLDTPPGLLLSLLELSLRENCSGFGHRPGVASLTAVLWPLPFKVSIAQRSMGSFLAVGGLPSSELWGGRYQRITEIQKESICNLPFVHRAVTLLQEIALLRQDFSFMNIRWLYLVIALFFKYLSVFPRIISITSAPVKVILTVAENSVVMELSF